MKTTKCECAVLNFLAVLFLVMMPAVSSAAENHTPRFTWQIRGGVVNAEQWIYDGDIPIALFENRTVEQPGQQLMFFNRVPRPIVLRHVKLTPDGVRLLNAFNFSARLVPTITDKLVGLDIEGQGTGRLKVTFVTQDRWKVATSTRVLTLTYDNKKGSYIYDFQGDLELHSPESFNGSGTSFEFSDPWFVGCPGPAVEFPGMWRKRFQNFVYESDDGSVKAIPVNHFTTSHKGGIKLKRDGMFLTAYETDGNPAIQFVGDTAGNSSISICWWGYDFHLSRSVTPDELFAPIPIHFRIFQCPDKTVQSLLKKGNTPPLGPKEWGGKEDYPIYERISSFDKGLRLDEDFEGEIDPFPWIINGDGAEWDKTSGRTDNFSMKINRKEAGLTRWQTFQGDGEGYFAEPWTPCKGYRVSCYVKTDSVKGRGSTLALQYNIPNSPQKFPIITAKKITGTRGWTKLEAEVAPPYFPGPEIGCLMIMLQQDGSGTTWFDDLEVTPVKNHSP